MTKWESNDETVIQWSFYADDESWQGMITEHDDYFSWWVMVPATSSMLTLTAEGDAGDREQAERLAEAVAKVLMVELEAQKADSAACSFCDTPRQVKLVADYEQASRDVLKRGGSES